VNRFFLIGCKKKIGNASVEIGQRRFKLEKKRARFFPSTPRPPPKKKPGPPLFCPPQSSPNENHEHRFLLVAPFSKKFPFVFFWETPFFAGRPCPRFCPSGAFFGPSGPWRPGPLFFLGLKNRPPNKHPRGWGWWAPFLAPEPPQFVFFPLFHMFPPGPPKDTFGPPPPAHPLVCSLMARQPPNHNPATAKKENKLHPRGNRFWKAPPPGVNPVFFFWETRALSPLRKKRPPPPKKKMVGGGAPLKKTGAPPPGVFFVRVMGPPPPHHSGEPPFHLIAKKVFFFFFFPAPFSTSRGGSGKTNKKPPPPFFFLFFFFFLLVFLVFWCFIFFFLFFCFSVFPPFGETLYADNLTLVPPFQLEN